MRFVEDTDLQFIFESTGIEHEDLLDSKIHRQRVHISQFKLSNSQIIDLTVSQL